jgi:hypothetical protein
MSFASSFAAKRHPCPPREAARDALPALPIRAAVL